MREGMTFSKESGWNQIEAERRVHYTHTVHDVCVLPGESSGCPVCSHFNLLLMETYHIPNVKVLPGPFFKINF